MQQDTMGGIRAEVSIHSPDFCPVTRVASAADAPASGVSKAVDDGTVTEEFLLHEADPPEVDAGDGVEEVFTYGSACAYQFERARGVGCPCDAVELHDCPILETHVRDGSLVIAFHARDIDHLRAVLTDLRERWANVGIRRLIQSEDERGGEELVVVDRSRLTDRQREVLETAHELGYFAHPKGANATEVAAELGITQATFAEHLAAAQLKLLGAILDTCPPDADRPQAEPGQPP